MGDDVLGATSASAKKKEEKARKKDQRAWENVIKSITHLPDSEKITVLQEKYVALYNDQRRAASNYQMLEKKFIVIQKERDQLRTELNKAILAKAKLESLCRELQKQNKAIKDENITRVKEEEEKRREVATNFTERLNSLSSMMDENKDKSVRLREENMNMTLKLTELYNKFQERENHLAEVNRQLDTQKELFDSKMKRMELEYKADRKAWEEESRNLLSNLIKSNEANRLLEENIKSMQANLDVYKNQYSDFEQTMSRSNEVFKTFHGEINKLQKSNTTLEKEKCEYVGKWKSCHNSIVEISEKNQQLTKKLEMGEKKIATLEKLCRQLQTERNTLHKQLQDKVEPLISTKQDLNVSSDTPTKAIIENQAINGIVNDIGRFQNQHPNRSSTEASLSKMERKPSESNVVSPKKKASDSSVDSNAEYTDLEQERAGSAPLLRGPLSAPGSSESIITEPSESSTETVTSDLSVSSEITIKEVRSLPTTKKEHQLLSEEQAAENLERPSSADLCGDLSLESVPLYKPAAVIDVPTQGGHATLVKESEACTNILEKLGSGDQELIGHDSPSDEAINLRASPGKTELKKE